MLYQQTGLPVVPVALNAGMFWGRAAWQKKSGCISVAFLPPIQPGLDKQNFMQQLENAIEEKTAQLELSAQ